MKPSSSRQNGRRYLAAFALALALPVSPTSEFGTVVCETGSACGATWAWGESTSASPSSVVGWAGETSGGGGGARVIPDTEPWSRLDAMMPTCV